MIRRWLQRIRDDWNRGCDIRLPQISGDDIGAGRPRDEARRAQESLNRLAAAAPAALRRYRVR